jgi:phage FluMu protein Com
MRGKLKRFRIKCNFCGHLFWRAGLDRFGEIRCPKCHEYDVEEAD